MAPSRIQVERVLCPTDFSECAARALARACDLAPWFEARVRVIHVIPFVLPAGPGLPYFPAPVEATRGLREQASEELQSFVKPFLGRGAALELKVCEGDPWREIVAEARALPADLIVMGTHGRSGLEHMLLGSVTERMLRRAGCPVLTVGTVPPRAGYGLFRRILCATDFSEHSESTVRTALSLAEENDAEVTLLHVVEGLSGAEAGRRVLGVPEVAPLRRDREARALARLREMTPADCRPWCEVRERVASGAPWRQILAIAEQTEADLVVMGAHDHGPIGRLFFGSTSGHVVRQAACPVLVVRQEEARRPSGRSAWAAAAGEKGGTR